jgi:molecular chaperone DnaJ
VPFHSLALKARWHGEGTNVSNTSLYDALDVHKDATADEVRTAYRKLARKLHPDVNPRDKAAEERFKEVSAAYGVLSDPEKRKLYDEFGADATRTGFDPEKARTYKRWQDQTAHGFGGGFSGSGPTFSDEVDLGDLFGDILSRGRGGAFAGGPPRPRPGADIEAELTISLEEAAQGTERGFRLTRPDRCSPCDGRGTTGPSETCASCQGTGGSEVAQGPLRFRAPCGVCGGSGQSAGPTCSSCGGHGAVERTVSIDVKIPAGTEDGQKLRLSGQGAAGRGGGPPGNLLVAVRLAPHALFRREGRDLLLELPVTVGEAMLGGRVDVPTLEGEVELKVPPRSNSGRRLRLRGKGLPGRDGALGDLYVTLQVRVPEVDPDDPAALQASQALDALYGEDGVRGSLRGRR